MGEIQPLNAWERGIAAMGRRFEASDDLADYVTPDAREALQRAWRGEHELAVDLVTSQDSTGRNMREDLGIFVADEHISLGAGDFDPTRIARDGAASLDDWFVWSGATALVALTGDDGRKRARLQTRLESFDGVAAASDSVLWSEDVLVALRDAYVEIVAGLPETDLRQKVRHLGMFATGLALGARHAPGLAPILWRAMDAHDVKSFRRYIMRGLSSRHASASGATRRALTEIQRKFEANDER